MKAAIFHEFGGPEVIRIEEVDEPAPGPGEVLVHVHAAALNRLDVWVRQGVLENVPMPHIGGSDIAGEVVETGAGATGVTAGDRVVVNPTLSCGRCEWCARGEASMCAEFRVVGEHTQGGFAEFVVVPATNLFPVPPDFDLTAAAAAPLAFLTAWRGLITRGRLRPGERVLITGASGGVATAAVQIARLAGARVYAVTSAEHVERVAGLGADVVYDRDAVDHSKEVWADTGRRGVDLVFDSVGAATWRQNIRALARGGRLVTYGATTGPIAETDLRYIFWKQLEVIGSTMSTPSEFRTVMRLVFDGTLKPVVDVVWRLERAGDAHARLERGEPFGKVVLTP